MAVRSLLDAPTAPVESVRVWDRFVRLFHWGLVGCVLVNYFVLTDGEDLHQWLGYAATALVLARVVWGFVGSAHARFSDFFPTPQRIRADLAAWRSGRVPRHSGHTPLGAVMMLVLMLTVLGLGLTGWLQTTDWFWGDERMQEVHEFLGQALISLAVLHAAAAIVMGRLERTNLVKAMFTGVKVFRDPSRSKT
jgi:cytochrome b